MYLKFISTFGQKALKSTSLYLFASVFVSLSKQHETSEYAPLLKSNVRLFIVISKCKPSFDLSSSILVPKNKHNEVTLLCSATSVGVPSDVLQSIKTESG